MNIKTTLSAALAAGLLLTAPVAAKENIAVVLDASGSMMGRIQGRTKIEIARDVVGNLVLNWNPQNHVALVAYGHNRKGDCNDIETLIPLGPMDARAFMGRVRSLQPKGMTPLSQAVINAAEGLRYSEHKATVVLVSDGEETCKLDPCAVGAELEKAGVDFTAHVIGFDVHDPKHQAQLRCLAENTGGRYFNASNADELNDALREAVAPPEPKPEPPKQPQASITAPDEVMATDRLTFQVASERETNPEHEKDSQYYVNLVTPDAKDSANMYQRMLEPGKLNHYLVAPNKPGDYELRYMRIHQPPGTPAKLYRLATRPIRVTPIEVRFDVAESYPADTRVSIPYSGPRGDLHFIVLFYPDGKHRHVQTIRSDKTNAEFYTPKEPGDYEIAFKVETLRDYYGRTRIRVVPKAP